MSKIQKRFFFFNQESFFYVKFGELFFLNNEDLK